MRNAAPYKCVGMFSVTPLEADFVRRRVGPFLQGCHRYTLEHLLAEAYLAGLKDAISINGAQ